MAAVGGRGLDRPDIVEVFVDGIVSAVIARDDILDDNVVGDVGGITSENPESGGAYSGYKIFLRCGCWHHQQKSRSSRYRNNCWRYGGVPVDKNSNDSVAFDLTTRHHEQWKILPETKFRKLLRKLSPILANIHPAIYYLRQSELFL